MQSKLTRTALVAGAAAALALGGALPALASTTISPGGPLTVTATSTDLAITTTGGLVLKCTNVNGTGTAPASPGNVNTGAGGIDVPLSSPPTLSSCKVNGIPATVTTAGAWAVNANADSGSPMGTLKIPASGATVKIGTTNGCTITVGASNVGPAPWINGTPPKIDASTPVGTVNFNTVTNGTGSPSCPPAGAGTGTMTGTLTFNSTPQLTVTT
ncbi:hypothetical protein [Rhodococcus sp. ACT016]|uniref:hypothetical protein n=1 Tax=Rhodococcus sp. ACT016 TaxID=3134808 RepID=UPI003D2D7411